MKILSLVLENINSLRGVVSIDFQDELFSEVGIFGITGPTGAGKSTLLDAISLALYGRIPRLGKTKPEQVISYGEFEAFAEVHFSVKNEVYSAKWTASVGKRSGKVNIKRELANQEGKIISAKIKEVEKKIIEITGLDFEHFGRSVMLAQGSFAAFLEANDNERSFLLEKITGSAIYRDISKMAFEKAKESKSKLEAQRAACEAIDLLQPEEKQQIQEQLNDLATENKILKEKQSELQSIKQKKERIEELTQKMEELQVPLKRLAQEEESQKLDLQQLSRYELAQPLASSLHQWEEKAKELKNLINVIAKAKENINLLQEKRNATMINFQQLSQEKEEIESEIEAKLPIFAQVRNINEMLKELTKEGKDKAEQLEVSEKELLAQNEKLTTLQKEKEQSQLALKQTQSWLEKNEHDSKLLVQYEKIEFQFKSVNAHQEKIENLINQVKEERQQESITQKQREEAKSLFLLEEEKVTTLQEALLRTTSEREAVREGQTEVEINAMLKESEENLQYFQKLKETQLAWNKLQKELEEVQAKQQEEEEKKEKYSKVLEELEDEKIQKEVLLHHAQEKAELEARIQSLEAERKKLQKGEACPLCGSVEHPFLEGHDYEEGKYRKERKQLEEQLKQLVKRIEKGRDCEKEVEKVLVRLQSKQENIQNKKTEIQDEFGKEIHTPLEVLEQQVNKLGQKVHGEAKRLEKLQQLQTQHEEALKQLQNAESKKAKAEQHLRSQEQELSLQKQRSTSLLAQQEEQMQAKQKAEQELEALIAPFQISLDKNLLQKLSQRKAAFEEKQNAAQTLKEESVALQTTLEKQQQRISHLEEKIKVSTEECEDLREKYKKNRDECKRLFEGEDVDAEEKRLLTLRNQIRKSSTEAQQQAESAAKNHSSEVRVLEEKEIRAADLHKQAQQKQSELLLSLQEVGFEDTNSLKEALAFESQAIAIAQTRERRKKKTHENEALLRQHQEDLQQLQAEKLPEITIPEVEEALNVSREKYEHNVGQQQALRLRLVQDHELEQKQSGLLESLQEIEKEYRILSSINEVIGSSSGDKFSRYAQSLTLGYLLQLANQYLQKLHGRYQIRKVPTAEADEKSYLKLEIIDRWQADNIRDVKLLSGGETFLVSLALALGLSDLAGGETQIETLFIDEGFGTLDAETLETAVSVLENLRARGKTIGVISHVKILQERLPLQIKVDKIPGSGFSNVYVVEH